MKKLILLVFSMSFSIIIIEIFLREINYPSHKCEILHTAHETTFDEDVGWTYKKNQKYTAKYGGSYTITNQGFRSLDLTDSVNKNKKLIFIIGDSYLFGHGLNFEETFGYKLAEKLNDDSYQIINFSAQAYGTDQMYLLARKLLSEYDPVAVITNYIYDHNLRNLNQDRRYIHPCLQYPATKPLFELKDNNLKQIARPIKYQDYDKFKIILAIKKIFERNLNNISDKKGKYISIALVKEMKNAVESDGSRFYLIEYNSDIFQLDFFNNFNVLKINTEVKNNEKLTIDSDDVHPNESLNSKIVEQFLQSYEKDFK